MSHCSQQKRLPERCLMFAMDVLYPLVPNDGLLQIVIKNAV